MSLGGSSSGIIIYLLIFAGIIYFMVIRPQQQNTKKRNDLMGALRTGDSIVTIGGIHGKVRRIREKTVIVRVAENVDIELIKTAIGTRIPAEYRESRDSDDEDKEINTEKETDESESK